MAFDRLDSVGLSYLWGKIKAAFATKSQVGDTAMGTTATTVTGAIKEHSDLIGSASMGTTASTLTGAIAEHETDINNLNSKFMIKNKTKTYTVAGNSGYNFDFYEICNNEQGYTPVGILGYSTNSEYVVPVNISLLTGAYGVFLKNLSNVQISNTLQAHVLYQKN